MESSKHNDELIKRKLADLSVEPRKLKFAEVHANYEKARKDAANKWGLYLIIGVVGIAALISAYLLLTPKTSEHLADNAVATEYSTEHTGNIQSVGTTSEDKSLERLDDKTNVNDPNGSTNSVNENITKNTDASTGSATKKETTNENSAKETSSKNTSENNLNTNDASNFNSNENSNDKKKIAKKNTSINSITEKKSANTTPSTELNKKETDASVSTTINKETNTLNKKETNTSTGSVTKNTSKTTKKSTTKKTPTSKNNNIVKNPIVKESSDPNKIEESLTKTNIKKQNQDPSYLKDVKETNNKATDTQLFVNSDVTTKAEDQNSGNHTKDPNNKNTKDIAKNETYENNNGKADQSAATQQGSNDQNNSSNTDNAYSEGKDQNSNDQVAKTGSVSNNNSVANKVDSATATAHIPGVIGTGSVSPRNKHKFLIGAEVSYSTLFYNTKENPNSPSQFSTGDPAFNTAYANASGKGKHSLFNGSASLNYLYNEQVGIGAGVSYFSLETKVDIQPSRTPQYTTAIDYVTWNSVVDSSVNPPTLTFVADTVYKQVPTGNYTSVGTTVNGDSVSTVSYVNKVRYISIPLNISYNFKIGAKFSIEPQAGILYTMPLKSSHLVATDAYKFEYKKQKADLRNNLYFNAALKIGYNITNRMQLYVREGYFFRNTSLYSSDQPISLSLKSIYTSFGITFRIR